MFKRILLPYRQVNAHIGFNQFIRECLTGGFNNYVDQRIILYPHPEKWNIHSYDLKVHSHLNLLFDTKEDAMQYLDTLLINNGFKLLNTKEEADRYKVLL